MIWIQRREFITLLGGAAAVAAGGAGAAARADATIGVFMGLVRGRSGRQARLAPSVQGLQELGWIEGATCGSTPRAVRATATRASARRNWSSSRRTSSWSWELAVTPLLQATAMPIVFVNVIDPVGAGLVASLARPGGNITGFTLFEYWLSGKWLELLKEIAPARDASGGAARCTTSG